MAEMKVEWGGRKHREREGWANRRRKEGGER